MADTHFENDLFGKPNNSPFGHILNRLRHTRG